MSDTTQLHVDLNREAHRRYRVLCTEQGVAMGEEVRQFIARRIEQLEKQRSNRKTKRFLRLE
jgi:hypothetical protein